MKLKLREQTLIKELISPNGSSKLGTTSLPAIFPLNTN